VVHPGRRGRPRSEHRRVLQQVGAQRQRRQEAEAAPNRGAGGRTRPPGRGSMPTPATWPRSAGGPVAGTAAGDAPRGRLQLEGKSYPRTCDVSGLLLPARGKYCIAVVSGWNLTFCHNRRCVSVRGASGPSSHVQGAPPSGRGARTRTVVSRRRRHTVPGRPGAA
jgi:hypothetical protein